MALLEGHDLVIGYQQQIIIQKLNLTFPDHKIIGLIGPNGSGKSTLLNVLSGLRQPQAGHVLLAGKPLNSYQPRQRARLVASLPQHPQAPGDIRVSELIGYGRYAYTSTFHGLQPADQDAIEAALVATELADFRQRPLADLSGGQQQRAFIGMTLAQGSDLLLLDEPTTYLDLTHQLEILKLLQQLNQQQQKTIILILHDLNQAARFCDFLVCLKDGEVRYQGSPDQVFTAEMLAEVFQIKASLQPDPLTGRPAIVSYDTFPKKEAPVCDTTN